MKKVYRSKTDRKISGVCGGLAEYFNIDSTIIRVVWVIFSFFSALFTGIIIYAICAALIPEEPDCYDTTGTFHND